jgi:hypothetical protein
MIVVIIKKYMMAIGILTSCRSMVDTDEDLFSV